MNTIRTLSIVIAGFTLAGGAAIASAATDQSPAPSAVVRYADLDISTPHGANELYHRIAGAASRVCPDVDNRNLSAVRARESCMQTAINSAVESVSSPRLAALLAAHSKHA
jgi:UrcA family protein